MFYREVNNTRIELVKGDITLQEDVEAIVNAANAELMPGGGVAGAIHRAAGPELADECRNLAPIAPGEAVITEGYKLPNSFVIHCLGPVYGVDKPEEELLANCYRRAIQLARENKIKSIAFPAISTGVFGYPKLEAAKVAFKAVLDELALSKEINLIRFVLFEERDLDIFQKVFED